MGERWPDAALLHSSGVWLVGSPAGVRSLAAEGLLAIEAPRLRPGDAPKVAELVAAVARVREVLGGEVIDGVADREQAARERKALEGVIREQQREHDRELARQEAFEKRDRRGGRAA